MILPPNDPRAVRRSLDAATLARAREDMRRLRQIERREGSLSPAWRARLAECIALCEGTAGEPASYCGACGATYSVAAPVA